MSRKNIIVKKLIALLLVSILPHCGGKEAVKEEIAVRVTLLVGNIDILRQGKSAGPAVLGDTVTAGDIIKTGDGAFAVVQIGDQSVFRIGPNTSIEVISLLSANMTELHLAKGEILSKVHRLTKGGQYKIVTPTTTAAVRGTEFLVTAEEKEEKIAVREGKVEVSIDKTIADIPEKESIVETGNTEIINIQTAEDGSPKVSVAIRPMTDDEQKITGTAAKIPIIPALKDITREELEKQQKDIIKNDETVLSPCVRDKDRAEKKKSREARIKKLIKQKPKSLEEIREVFERIDEVSLYSGKVLKGAIITRSAEYSILTTSGVIKVPKKEVRSVRVIK